MMRLPAAAKMMVLPITMLWSIHTHADASIKFHAGTPVREVVSAPEFARYGRLLFPADNRYWSGDSLGSLKLTWYSEIRPASTVAVVNRLRADVLAKRRVFFDIYTEQEKQADPRKRNTGLFFFRGTPGARFAVCNAGGGFMFVGAIHDSFPHALSLSERGINAFALIYRPGAETACEDLARAIRFIFDHAKELEVNTEGYSLWGGSAGARMATWLGSYGTASFGEKHLPRPAAVIMQYTGAFRMAEERFTDLRHLRRPRRHRSVAGDERTAGCNVAGRNPDPFPACPRTWSRFRYRHRNTC